MDATHGSIITAAATPFAADGSVNHDAFRALLRHLAQHGSDAVVVCGTTGESPTLSDDEKLALLRTAVDELRGSIPVIAGTGSNNTAHSVELTRAACDLGVDGILAVTPYYNKPPREGLLRHFRAIAEASSVPVILYNIPARVVINLPPDLIAELASIDNIVAVKQANPDLDECRELRRLAPDLAIYAGNDDSLLPMVELGAVGGICVASHLVGEEMGRVVELWQQGQHEQARALDASLRDVYDMCNIAPNPIPVKAALAMAGFDMGAPRLPLVEATDEQAASIRATLERHELLQGAVH